MENNIYEFDDISFYFTKSREDINDALRKKQEEGWEVFSASYYGTPPGGGTMPYDKFYLRRKVGEV